MTGCKSRSVIKGITQATASLPYHCYVASLLIPNLDEETQARLREQATHKGHSIEEEAREILESALRDESAPGAHLVDRIIRRMKPLGGVDLPLIPRDEFPEPPVLEE